MNADQINGWALSVVDLARGQYRKGRAKGENLKFPEYVDQVMMDFGFDPSDEHWCVQGIRCLALSIFGEHGARVRANLLAGQMPIEEISPPEPEAVMLFPIRIGNQLTLALSS